MEKDRLTVEEKATNADTWEHIDLVMRLLSSAQIELMRRQFTHDRSKLKAPEVSIFTEYTPKLRDTTYGSPDYYSNLSEMKVALDHHYTHNRHHPEYFDPVDANSKYDKYIAYLESIRDDLNKDIIDNLLDILKSLNRQETSRINSMNLFDILEMIIDWIASTKRHEDGNIKRSLDINRERFNISPQLMSILENTVPWIVDSFSQYKTQKDLNL